jgi:hypothetical protein
MDMTQHSATSAALSDSDSSETTLLELRDEDLRTVSGGNWRPISRFPSKVVPTPRRYSDGLRINRSLFTSS